MNEPPLSTKEISLRSQADAVRCAALEEREYFNRVVRARSPEERRIKLIRIRQLEAAAKTLARLLGGEVDR